MEDLKITNENCEGYIELYKKLNISRENIDIKKILVFGMSLYLLTFLSSVGLSSIILPMIISNTKICILLGAILSATIGSYAGGAYILNNSIDIHDKLVKSLKKYYPYLDNKYTYSEIKEALMTNHFINELGNIVIKEPIEKEVRPQSKVIAKHNISEYESSKVKKLKI